MMQKEDELIRLLDTRMNERAGELEKENNIPCYEKMLKKQAL
jgi:hypothetical protein